MVGGWRWRLQILHELDSEFEERFIRSGTAKSAVHPVEMTGFGWWMVWEKPPRCG